MSTALHAFLAGLIDYAGLFPPAALDLETAFSNYLEYRRSPERFMLGRFICPAGRLEELLRLLPPASERVPLAVILGSPADLSGPVAAFSGAAGEKARVEVLEMKGAEPLPGFPEQPVFRETGFPAGWRESIPAFVGALRPPAGLKIRLGGLEPAAFPATGMVACAIRACCSTGVPFKATAGLHDPLRKFDAGLGVMMHGFVNVFGAGLLAAEHALPEQRIEEILEDAAPASFRFEHDVFAWRDLAVSARAIERYRRTLAVSFGSCSFDEPRAGLRTLGFLAEEA